MLMVHVIALSMFRAPASLVFMYMVGPALGVLNHGLTSRMLRWADRAGMGAGLCLDLLWTLHWAPLPPSEVTSFLLIEGCAIVSYCMAKVLSRDARAPSSLRDVMPLPCALHCASHAFVSSAHVLLLSALQSL